MTGETDRTRETENDAQRTDREGRPPRPATEPRGSEWSTRNRKTDTDPATGEPTKSA